MLYNLLVPWASEWTALNVFRYITFRSMAALITALVLSILLGPRFIAWLRRLKCGQHILHEVTAHACKEGTPTMGGLLMLFSLTVSLLLWADLGNFYIWQTLLVFWGFAAVGFWDDMTKLRHAENRGISGRAKLAGQLVVAVVAMLFLVTDPGYSSQLSIPFVKDWAPDLGPLYLPFGVFVMVASSNAVNLTDGLDGLCTGVTFVSMIGYLLAGSLLGFVHVSLVAAVTAGACAGFLVWNFYPAKVFMGDTGSMFFGGIVTALAFVMQRPELVLFFGIVYIWDAMTVVIQRAYFKATHGKRIFRMTPIHHAFEMRGWREVKIDGFFALIAAIGVAMGMLYICVA